jgi:hypothetical protein
LARRDVRGVDMLPGRQGTSIAAGLGAFAGRSAAAPDVVGKVWNGEARTRGPSAKAANRMKETGGVQCPAASVAYDLAGNWAVAILSAIQESQGALGFYVNVTTACDVEACRQSGEDRLFCVCWSPGALATKKPTGRDGAQAI